MVGLRLPQVSRRPLLCQVLGKEDATHYRTLCESQSPVGEDNPPDRSPCGLGSPQSIVDQFPWSQIICAKAVEKETTPVCVSNLCYGRSDLCFVKLSGTKTNPFTSQSSRSSSNLYTRSRVNTFCCCSPPLEF